MLSTSEPWNLSKPIPRAASDRKVQVPWNLASSRTTFVSCENCATRAWLYAIGYATRAGPASVCQGEILQHENVIVPHEPGYVSLRILIPNDRTSKPVSKGEHARRQTLRV